MLSKKAFSEAARSKEEQSEVSQRIFLIKTQVRCSSNFENFPCNFKHIFLKISVQNTAACFLEVTPKSKVG